MEDGLLTVEGIAQRTGRTAAQVRASIVAGEIATRIVDRDGRLQVMVPEAEAQRLKSGADARPTAPDSAQAPTEPAAAEHAKLARAETTAIATPEIRQLAAGLADELFQRWELAMQEQFRAELKVRLRSELEHRQKQAADLQEEVAQRAEQRFGPGGAKVVGMADRYSTWERERTLTRQSRELMEIERQMREMRERLADLGVVDASTLTVDRKEREGERGADGTPNGRAQGSD